MHFVNSGAEAIDLAVLLARAFTRHFEVLTLRDAYHGMHFGAMTATGIGRRAQPGAAGARLRAGDGAASLPRPSGPRRRRPYLAEADAHAADATPNGAVAALIAEPIQGYGGIVEMPHGWLRGAAEQVRAAGGLLDRRRRGAVRLLAALARTSGASSRYDVLPDVIVMSKGIGDGFPLAAVATRREIAAAMTRRMFFNTYGSESRRRCAAGAPCCEPIAEEGLHGQRAARRRPALERASGARRRGTRPIGDVRGRGLLLGVELVRDRSFASSPPAKPSAYSSPCSRAAPSWAQRGREHNVIKIESVAGRRPDPAGRAGRVAGVTRDRSGAAGEEDRDEGRR